MKKVSIIVPTKNEENNIKPLMARIARTLKAKNISYEVIVIDDHSTDKTYSTAKALEKKYPISIYLKKGPRGKAQSLIEGFTYAKYPLLCMIDADLQYPPEAIPDMLEKCKKADIVVGDREYTDSTLVRKLYSRTFLFFFVHLLHGVQVDAQSGLKVIKKNTFERILPHLTPTSWTFDLEFLKKSLEAGYTVDAITIPFAKRHSGKSKLNIFKGIWEIGLGAIQLKLKGSHIIPFEEGDKNPEGFHYNGTPFSPYTQHPLQQSALKPITATQLFLLFSLFYLLVASLITHFHLTVIIFISLISFLYFFDLLFNLLLIYRSFSESRELTITKKDLLTLTDDRCPGYTIFCPLYKEWNVVPQFITAMSDMDYPKEKLQVMLLLEEDDTETIEKIRSFNLPDYFSIVVVPHAKPKTKPKALNYGMKFATEDYVVIYDAEDIPERDQLKKAVIAFNKASSNIVCIQAKLNFYNPHQNLLTRIFTAEYSLWFDLVLTGLQSINATIPLGGTSNHFRKNVLLTLNGWDAFNVTEDADLGIRLVKNGKKTAIIDSTTYEEANSSLSNWFNQRTRWIKGYIQTYFVHSRDLKGFKFTFKEPHLLTFQLIIGGKIFSMLVNPLMWILTVSYFVFRTSIGSVVESFFPSPVLYIAFFSLVFGNFLYLYYYMIGAAKRDQWEIIPYVWLTPFYWLCMSISAGRAVWEFVWKPFYWSKTRHGLHLQKEEENNIVIPGEFATAQLYE